MTVHNQRIFYHIGVTTVEKFAALAKDRTDLVAVLKEHWGLDQEASLVERVQVAAIACAHQNAVTRSQRAAEVDAEHDVQDRVKPVIAGEWSSMKTALEKRLGIVEDRIMPAKEYVEKKLGEIEKEDSDPMNPQVGEGPPRSCKWKGVEVPFHGGGGLPSPGRWKQSCRRAPGGIEWKDERGDRRNRCEEDGKPCRG